MLSEKEESLGSIPVILDNVENFIEIEEIKKPEDNEVYDQGPNYLNVDNTEILKEEVDGEDGEQIALLAVPEVDTNRVINKDRADKGKGEMTDKNQKMMILEKEEKSLRVKPKVLQATAYPGGEIRLEALTDYVRNIPEIQTVDDRSEATLGRYGERLTWRGRDSRAEILRPPETPGNNDDDIVFILYLDETEPDGIGGIEDLVFQD